MKKLLTIFLTGLSFTGFAQSLEGVNEEDLFRQDTAVGCSQPMNGFKTIFHIVEQPALTCSCLSISSLDLHGERPRFYVSPDLSTYLLNEEIDWIAFWLLWRCPTENLVLFPQPFQANYREPQTNK